MLLTVDTNGKDATQAGFDPKNIAQYGFEPQRDDLRRLGAYWAAGSAGRGADGKTVQIPEPWAAAWKWFYDGIWKDHFIDDGPALPEPGDEPERLPVLHRQGRHGRELPVVHLLRRAAPATTGTSPRCRPTTGQTTAAFNADTFRILKDTKHPDEAFKVLTYLLGDAAEELTQTYGAMPADPASRTPSSRRSEPPGTTASRSTRRRSTGRSPSTASTTPTCRTSSRTCPPTTSRSTCSTPSAPSGRRRRGSTWTARSTTLKTQLQAIWDKAVLIARDDRTQRRASAPPAAPPSRGWRGGARAGGYSSSRRGSSASCCSRSCRCSRRWRSRSPTSTWPRTSRSRSSACKNYQDPARRPAGVGLAARHVHVRRSCRCRSRSSLPFAGRADAPLAPPARLERRSGSCSSCPTSCRSWPAC